MGDEFKPGDVVRHKGGGPEMVVERVAESEVLCEAWNQSICCFQVLSFPPWKLGLALPVASADIDHERVKQDVKAAAQGPHPECNRCGFTADEHVLDQCPDGGRARYGERPAPKPETPEEMFRRAVEKPLVPLVKAGKVCLEVGEAAGQDSMIAFAWLRGHEKPALLRLTHAEFFAKSAGEKEGEEAEHPVTTFVKYVYAACDENWAEHL